MNERLRFFIPYIAFVGTALIVLLLDFGWIIPLSEQDGALYDYFPQGIYVMPILWLVIMCFPIAYIIFYEDKLFELHEESPESKLSTFIVAFTGLFLLIMLFRTMIIWRFNGPYEKMSMIFFLLFQILLVEQVSLVHYGLEARAPWDDWKKDLKYLLYISILGVLLLIPAVIIAIIVFYPQLVMVLPQMIIPNGFILISFPFQTIAVGISEELMFRGYMYENVKEHDPNYEKRSHMYFWILINSFIFGCFHIPWYIEPGWVIPPENIGPMVSRIISTGAFGVFMCLVYEHTGSLRITIIFHGLWNTIGAFLGSMFLYLDFSIIDTITNEQYMTFAIIAAGPLLIALILGLKLPRYLARRLNY